MTIYVDVYRYYGVIRIWYIWRRRKLGYSHFLLFAPSPKKMFFGKYILTLTSVVRFLFTIL